MMRASWYVLAALGACGGGGGGGGGDPAQRPLGTTIRWAQKASTETVICYPFKLDNTEPIFADRLGITVSLGSHHAHVYRAETAEPDVPFDCTNGMDWDKWKLVFGAQTRTVSWTLPAGVTLPLGPRQQMLVQIHSLNATDTDVDASVIVDVHETEDTGMHLGVLFGVNKRVKIAPGETVVARQFCPLPEGAQVAAIMGHYHALGERYRVAFGPESGAAELVYEAADESTLTFKEYAPAIAGGAGDGLRFECTFHNFRDIEATWGPDTRTQEHCNVTAYYYGGTPPASPLCLQE